MTVRRPDGKKFILADLKLESKTGIWYSKTKIAYENLWQQVNDMVQNGITHWAPMPQPEEDALEKALQEFEIEFPPGGYMHGPGSVIQYNVDRFKAMHPEFFAED